MKYIFNLELKSNTSNIVKQNPTSNIVKQKMDFGLNRNLVRCFLGISRREASQIEFEVASSSG